VLKAVIFDVDGTLAETEEFHRRAFNATFAALGYPHEWTFEHYRRLLLVTGGKERLRAFFGEIGQPVSDAAILQLHETKNRLYGRMMQEGAIALRPGVARLLEECEAQGVALGIATTTSPENLDALLRPLLSAHWSERFASVVAGDQVARKKPAPDVYVACLAGLGVRADEAIAVEDSLPGLRSARAAGITTVVTPGIFTGHEDFAGAVAVLPGLGSPEAPWAQDLPGFARRWLTVQDLRRLWAQRNNGAGAELAQ